ncbi:hypothetical protein DFH08DRAFT_1088961 [Mycena albidolilacea]|uniref:Uncharacterized protein n=1 Tax=Mycena albidolilacea TaxID=1033008 RepID=A0AAD6Z389_9AGAR|nr:hypothetical protein DFH08DRAFT_1088961 [Mycena albidolilacea]
MPAHPCYYRENLLPLPNIRASIHLCPKPGCGQRLKVQQTKKGANYLACFRPHSDNAQLWYWFPAPAPVVPTSRQDQVPAHSLASRQPSVDCTAPTLQPCTKRVNRSCDRHMCRQHCVDRGGCQTHSVDKPPAEPLTPLLDHLKSYADKMVLQSTNRLATHTQHEQQAARHALALKTPLPPSPSLSEEEEYVRITRSSPSSARSAPFHFETTHRLLLVFWIAQGCSALVQAVQDLPPWRQSWPRVRLSDLTNLLTTPRFPEIHPFYEYYSKELASWVKIPVSYVFTVTTNTQLFIRRVGVIGSDQAHHLSRIAPPATSRNMLTTSKRKRSSTPIDIKDDTEPTVKQEPITPPRAKRPRVKHDAVHGIKLEPVTPPRATHPRLGLDSVDSSEIIDLTTPSPPSLTFSSSSSSLLSLPSLASSSSLEFPHPIHLLSRLDTAQIPK